MIVTDTRPVNNNFIVKNKYCSTIIPPPYVGGDTLMLFLISYIELYILFNHKSIKTLTFNIKLNDCVFSQLTNFANENIMVKIIKNIGKRRNEK